MFTPQAPNPALAAVLTLLASAFVAGTTLLAKALGTGALGPALNPLQISQGRFLFAFIAFSLLITAIRPKITRVHFGLHLGRSSFGWGGVTLMFAAASYIPLSDATAITFLNPVIGMMLAIPLLGEKVGPVRWTAAVIAIAGATLLLRPTPASFEPAALIALAAAVSMGIELIFIKTLSGREGPWQILFVNNAIGVVIATIAALFVWQAPNAAQWAALAAIGLMMAVAQTCFINAVARADASFVAPFFYATLVFAALYDAAVFGVLPDAVSVIGAGIILTGAGLLAWREARLRV